MSEAKFTKGGWVCATHNGLIKRAVVYVEGGAFDISNLPNAIPNARLIAKSPDMYEMLERLANCDECQMHREEINNLLAEVRGEL